MPGLHAHELNISQRPHHRFESRLWRFWWFVRVMFRHFRGRLLVMAFLLGGGSVLFKRLEPEQNHSFIEAMFFTWSLIFGESPESFPKPLALQIMFFALPVLGLILVMEGIVEFALMLRDRQLSERKWCIMMASSVSNHIVLVGVGRLGIRTYRLLRMLGEAVVVIEQDADNRFLEEVRRNGSPLLVGDARRDELLDEANVAKARSIVLASDDDLANLEIALDARRLQPKIRVVLRMFDQNMADKIADGFNIHIAMSQSAMASPAFATAAIDRSIVNSFVVDNQLIVIQRRTVQADDPLCSKSIDDIMRQFGFAIVERIQPDGDKRLFPPPQTQLEAGDRLMVQGPFEALRKLPESPEQRGHRPTTPAASANDGP